MNQLKPWQRAFTIVLVFVALLALRGPLTQWFTGDSMEHSANGPTGDSQHTFEAPQLTALRSVFTAAEEIRFELSLDQVGALPAASSKIHTELGLLADADVPESVKAAISQATNSATALAESKTAVVARAPFGTLSEALFQLAAADPRLQEGWNVFFCPMADGFQKWFQAPTEIENPYMGQEMLVCGSEDEWTQALADDPPQGHDGDVAHYTCSMHPSVRQQEMGACPICSMDLTPVTHEDLRTGDVLVDSVRRQRIGVRTQVVTQQPIVHSIRAVGEVVWDQSEVHDVTARVDGWIEDMQVDAVGDSVQSGQTLFRFYSPNLLATQRELLAAVPGSSLAASARERLHLWGMSDWALQDVLSRGEPKQKVSIHSPIKGVVVDKQVNEGAFVRAGSLLYRIVDSGRVWVQADVFEQDLPNIKEGQRVVVTLPHAPDHGQEGEVSLIYPTLETSSRTGRVRIELDNPDGALRPGMLADVTFTVDLGEHLAVASEAIIYTGARRLVFVDKGEGRLRPVEIQTGPRSGDWTVIDDGLSEGERVVTSGAFLLAAESRIRSATDYWEATDETQ
jgi:Cu(I)/Ag(I) efflux system membrane fusion protein